MRSLLKNIGPWSKRNALASSGVTNGRGPIFFRNDRSKGYYTVIIPNISNYDFSDRHLRDLIGSRHVVAGPEKSVTDRFG